MSNSLQDQLLKAGLVNEKKLKQHKRAKKKQSKLQPKGHEPESEASIIARQTRDERARKDREHNLALRAAAEEKAVASQIRQMIEDHRIDRSRGDIAYQFVDQGKIKKLYVNAEQQGQLSRGQIGIAKLDDAYQLIPANVAAKIQQRDQAAVLFLQEKSDQQTDEDDPYADYPIPDDLMW